MCLAQNSLSRGMYPQRGALYGKSCFLLVSRVVLPFLFHDASIVALKVVPKKDCHALNVLWSSAIACGPFLSWKCNLYGASLQDEGAPAKKSPITIIWWSGCCGVI